MQADQNSSHFARAPVIDIYAYSWAHATIFSHTSLELFMTIFFAHRAPDPTPEDRPPNIPDPEPDEDPVPDPDPE
jgi:hypothetical protein